MESIASSSARARPLPLRACARGIPGDGTGGTGIFMLDITDAASDFTNLIVVECISLLLRGGARVEPLHFDFAPRAIVLCRHGSAAR